MLKQAFKASLKVDLSSSILKEAKSIFSLSLQWHSRRLITTYSKLKWDLFSAVCLERHPVITKPMNEMEKSYFELLKQIEYENSLKSTYELKVISEQMGKEFSSRSKKLYNANKLQTTQEFEDSCIEELNTFKFAPRITEFDKSNDKTSHMRKLDKSLVLLVKQKLNNVDVWLPPQGLRKDGETMRNAAERVLQEFCGSKILYKFYGNAPVGFCKYKYTEKNKESGKSGAKIFYFLAKYKKGSIVDDLKYQWLDKDEIKETIPQPFYQCMSDILITE